MRKDKSQKSKKVVTIPEIKIKKTSVQKIKNLKKNEKRYSSEPEVMLIWCWVKI